MTVEEMPFYVGFADVSLVGAGLNAYLFQRQAILADRGQGGHFQRLLKFSGKAVVIDYYLSEKLDILFVLTGHVVKAEDRRIEEIRALKEYLSWIRRIETEEDR